MASARALGVPDIIDRCNLTVLLEPGQEDLAAFLAQHRVHVVASLPCYGEKNVDAQRGSGVFDRSIAALQVAAHALLLLAWLLGRPPCRRPGGGCSTARRGGPAMAWVRCHAVRAQMLNEVGYGRPGTGLTLDLVYNPGGAFLAPDQVGGAGAAGTAPLALPWHRPGS